MTLNHTGLVVWVVDRSFQPEYSFPCTQLLSEAGHDKKRVKKQRSQRNTDDKEEMERVRDIVNKLKETEHYLPFVCANANANCHPPQ